MNKKVIIGWSVVIALIAFWWIEIRPVTGREGCYDLALESVGIDKGETNLELVARNYDRWLPAYNSCLKNRGI